MFLLETFPSAFDRGDPTLGGSHHSCCHFPLSLAGLWPADGPHFSLSSVSLRKRAHHPPMAPFSSQWCKHHCPSGNSTIAGWTALGTTSRRHYPNVQPGRSSWEDAGLNEPVPPRIWRLGRDTRAQMLAELFHHRMPEQPTNSLNNESTVSIHPSSANESKQIEWKRRLTPAVCQRGLWFTSSANSGLEFFPIKTAGVPSRGEMVVCQLGLKKTFCGSNYTMHITETGPETWNIFPEVGKDGGAESEATEATRNLLSSLEALGWSKDLPALYFWTANLRIEGGCKALLPSCLKT